MYFGEKDFLTKTFLHSSHDGCCYFGSFVFGSHVSLACSFLQGYVLLRAAFCEFNASLAITLQLTEPCFAAQLIIGCLESVYIRINLRSLLLEQIYFHVNLFKHRQKISSTSWKALFPIAAGAALAAMFDAQVSAPGMFLFEIVLML